MIRLEHVSFAYPGGEPVLRDFSAELPERGLIRLCGPSGCGKTTLLRLICGLERPTEGRVLGVEPGGAAVVFQEDRLIPWLTALENTAAVSDLQRAARWLAELGLEGLEYKRPEELSGGQRRRVAIARALAYESRLLALDEPFTGLDRPLAERVLELLRGEAARKPVLLVSHELEFTADLELWPCV